MCETYAKFIAPFDNPLAPKFCPRNTTKITYLKPTKIVKLTNK